MAEDTPINNHLLEMRAMAIDLELSGFPIEEEAQKQVILKNLPISWRRMRLGLQCLYMWFGILISYILLENVLFKYTWCSTLPYFLV